MKKKSNNKVLMLVTLFCVVSLSTSGCTYAIKSNGDNPGTKRWPETQNMSEVGIEVITAGDSTVLLDEVRYYAYNTQATYETYYLIEKKELDWNSEMSSGVTLAEAVKSTLLDNICEREAIVSYAEKYQITLSTEEWAEVYSKVDTFYEETNAKLLDKIDIKKQRLTEIFWKDKLFQKVKSAMDMEETGKSANVYKKWKTVNTVTTNEYWDDIVFDTPIFTEEDLK